MHTILIVNNDVQNCGVYQYGKRFANICLKSKLFNFVYLEATSLNELFLTIKTINPVVIIYNYIPVTMPWMHVSFIDEIRSLKIKQGNIIHNLEFNEFDFYLHQNPYYQNNDNNFAILRPLFEYTPKEIKRKDAIQIGTFGFGGEHKLIYEICEVITKEFIDKNVELNFHITKGFYCCFNSFEELKIKCNNILHKNIKLNLTNDFLTNEMMLDFLFHNDLNVFFYHSYSSYNGLSSSIDYALSVKKPIAICKSDMFSHIIDVSPSICIEDLSLNEIINNGFEPLQKKYNEWSNEKFINNIENIMKKII